MRRAMRDSAYRLGILVLVSLLALNGSRAPANSLTLLGLAEPAGLIAFVDGDGRPGVVDPRNGSRVPLTDDPQRAQFPAWSPTGDAVSFIGFDLAGPGVDVYRLGAGGERVFERVRLYERAAEAPIYHGWSPDGRWLAVLANRADGLGLYLLPAPGPADGTDAAGLDDGALGEPRLLATGAPFYWDWSSDGATLLVHRNVLGPDAEVGFTGLASYALDASFAAPGAFRSPAVSPSARWIVYATRDAGDTRRVVLQRVRQDGAEDGAAEARRALPHAGFAAFAWHPRRDLVAIQRAVVEAPHGYGPIVTIDAATGDLNSVTDDLALAFWWSPDGGSIAYLSPVAGWNGPEQQVARPVQAGGTRLALRVADVATGLIRELGRFTPSPLFLNQYLPFFDQYARSHRLWSPASDALVMPVLEAGRSVLTVYGLDGSVRTLGPGDMPAWNVR